MTDEIMLPEILTNSGFSLGKHIFRYRADRDIDKVENGQPISKSSIIEEMENFSIWHSAIDALNDPFEVYAEQNLKESEQMSENQIMKCWIRAGLKSGNNKLMVSADEYIYKEYKENECYFKGLLEKRSKDDEFFNDTINNIRDYTGVACFTSKCDSRLMWGYYCNGLKGVCLIYNSELLLRQKITLNPVKYSDCPFEFNLLNFVYEYKNDWEREDLFQMVKRKHSEWSHEVESRSVVELREDEEARGRLIEMNDSCIEGVIIGRKVRDDVKNTIIKLSKSIGFKVFMADVDYKLFGVKIS